MLTGSLADFLAMLTFVLGIVNFTTEHAVWGTIGKGKGLGMAVGVPGVMLVCMGMGWSMRWYRQL